jgi:hypothetical protein
MFARLRQRMADNRHDPIHPSNCRIQIVEMGEFDPGISQWLLIE